jgi:hypothetical protein
MLVGIVVEAGSRVDSHVALVRLGDRSCELVRRANSGRMARSQTRRSHRHEAATVERGSRARVDAEPLQVVELGQQLLRVS